MSGSNFGIIGLGTMGRNLALNIESRGYRVAVWNLETEWVGDFISEPSRREVRGHDRPSSSSPPRSSARAGS